LTGRFDAVFSPISDVFFGANRIDRRNDLKRQFETMSAKKKQPKPIPSPERLKREAEALRANLARRKQQQRARKDTDPAPDAETPNTGTEETEDPA
jgi:hypothetical protein